MRPSEAAIGALSQHLKDLGFLESTRPRHSFQLLLAAGVFGRVSFDFSSTGRSGLTSVFPSLFVWHESIARLVTSFLGQRYDKVGAGGIGRHLGYLMPEDRYRTWELDTNARQEFELQVTDLVDAIERHGIPWLKQYVRLETLGPALLNAPLTNVGANYSRPVVRLLLEGRTAAVRELDVMRQRFSESQVKPNREFIDLYVKRFKMYLEQNPASYAP